MCATAPPFTAGGQTAPSLDQLFSPDRLQKIHLEMDPADWATLRERYLTNDYYWCRVRWNGLEVKAAVRSRGNGSRSPFKPGLKLSFTRSKDSGPFLGQESLVLNNMAQDPTMIKNALAYGMFAKAGLPAPRLGHARVSINGQYWGVYQTIEEIESPYLRDRLGESNGYLYEYSWKDEYRFEQRGEGRDSDYVPAPFEPKNNSKNPNPAPLVGWIEAINQAPDAEFVAQVSAYTDPRQVLTYLAVETLTGERDGLLGHWGMNGFYLYNYAKTTKFALLPWDKDWSFYEVNRPVLEGGEHNVLVRRLIQDAGCRTFFLDQLRRCAQLAGGPGGWLEEEARRRSALIWKSAAEDPNRLEGGGTMAVEFPKLLEFVQRRSANVLAQL